MTKIVPVPTKPDELDALHEHSGTDAVYVYSDDDLAISWLDSNGDRWWLVQSPDGSFFKTPMMD